MVKRNYLVLGFVLGVLLVSLVSASGFGDFWGKITGQSVGMTGMATQVGSSLCMKSFSTTNYYTGSPKIASFEEKDKYIKSDLYWFNGYRNTIVKLPDQCISSDVLLEYYCVPVSSGSRYYTVFRELIDCENDCLDGKCNGGNTCYDTDGSTGYSTKGRVMGLRDGNTYTRWDNCTNGKLYEQRCTTDGKFATYTWRDCGTGLVCSDGKCVSSGGTPIGIGGTGTTTPVATSGTCTDSDNSGNVVNRDWNVKWAIFTDGNVRGVYPNGTSYTKSDICENMNRVKERFCGNVNTTTIQQDWNKPWAVGVNCPTGQTCTSGRCSGSSCTSETDLVFCARLGKDCGSVTALDNCGVRRTVRSCGTCASGACSPSGTCSGSGNPGITPTVTPTCTDSDLSTQNPYQTLGTLTGVLANGSAYNYIDKCDVAVAGKLKEGICNYKVPSITAYICPSGVCQNGACVGSSGGVQTQPTPSCNDTDGINSDVLGNVFGLRTSDLTYYNLSDSCSETEPNVVSERGCLGVVANLTNKTCGEGLICMNGICDDETLAECLTSEDCVVDLALPICDAQTKICVGEDVLPVNCESDFECAIGEYCNTDGIDGVCEPVMTSCDSNYDCLYTEFCNADGTCEPIIGAECTTETIEDDCPSMLSEHLCGGDNEDTICRNIPSYSCTEGVCEVFGGEQQCSTTPCPNGCSDGICISVTGETTCNPVRDGGPRINPRTRIRNNGVLKYCNPTTLDYSVVLANGAGCVDDYECQSNVCLDGVCTSIGQELNRQASVLQKIWCFMTFITQYTSDCTNAGVNNGYCQCINPVTFETIPETGGLETQP